MNKKIADNIINARKKLAFSQAELARRAHCTHAAISIIEKSERIPSLALAYRIAKSLNIPVSELTDDSNNYASEYSDMFYVKFREIDDLNHRDQQIILSMVKKLKKANKQKHV